MRGRAYVFGLIGIAALVALPGCEGGDELVEGVDLKVVELRIPSATGLDQGSTATLTVLVKNNGTEPISTEFVTRIDFYENAALTLSSAWDSVELSYPVDISYPEGHTGVLASGVTVALEAETTVDATDPPQLVFCRATCDSGGAIAEANEGNNSYVKACQVVPGGPVGPAPDEPDLVIGSLVVPATVERGNVLDVSLIIRNDGGVAAPAPFTVEVAVYEDQSHLNALWTPWNSVCEEDLDPGAEVPYDLSFTSRPTDDLGPVYLVATVDRQDDVRESREDNNTYSGQSEIVLPPGPDLVISGVSAPDPIVHGETVNVTVTVRNVGGSPAQPFDVSFQVLDDSDVPIRTETSGRVSEALVAGTETEKEFPFTALQQDGEGLISFRAVADSSNEVDEGNFEGNNSGSATAQLSLPPDADLVVSIDSCTATYEVGGPGDLSITYTVTNQGSEVALGSLLKLKLVSQVDGSEYPLGGLLSVPELTPPGGANTFTDTKSFNPDGVPPSRVHYLVYAVADATNVLVEESETNNTDTAPVLVYIPSGPDLIAIIDFCSPALDFGESSAKISVQYTVKNNDSEPAGASNALIELTDLNGTLVQAFGPYPVGALGAGASASFTRNMRPNSVPQRDMNYYIRVVCDIYDAVSETDETNNADTATVYID